MSISFGGDYNPEQWPEELQAEDVRLMNEAGVDLATVGVFSWALLEPEPGAYDFAWLDRVLDRLGAAGVGVDLATATASPPPWLAHRHPEVLPVTADGTTLWPGGRQAFCPSSPVYREHALRLCRAMAERYAGHPALRLWHVGNELGCHNALCYCDMSAAAFRTWLAARYGDVTELNRAWGTAFWSQRYGSFDEVQPPRTVTATANPTQQLDFRRFSSDEHLANFVAERDVLHEVSPGVPVTTNFMVTSHIKELDYHRWAAEMDLISNDFYVTAADPEGYRELAFCADQTRGLAGGGPWLLMEQSTSAVNWQPRNVAKQPGELLRNSVQHVARGADGILFFQWRASQAGSEKFHSALVPHAGTDTRVWREVVELSRTLDRLDEVVGSRTVNDVALLVDYQAWWACELDSHPSVDVTYLDRPHAVHAALTDLGIGVDVVHPDTDLSGYRLVVVPTLYTVTDAAAAAIDAAVRAGATALVTYFSGITDEHDHVRLGGYPGAFRDLLGIRVEEFYPLRSGERISLSDGSGADVWTELLHLDGATAEATYADGPLPGVPAITRHEHGEGVAWYAATRLDQHSLDALVRRVATEAGVRPIAPGRAGVEITERTDGQRRWTFVVNHTDTDAEVDVAGHDLVRDAAHDGRVPPGGVAVIRR
ncbi:beta-galactosidase [Nocardioides sp. Root1257]|uniref:beta-galactosidase n=1 Tax=unclassified Nocardioides TaxID=2615069 RepID=UPI0006FB1F5C|nr:MULTISPECIES: beta-galactosidase [unclassified Nocardioides]KQW47532.1 beta-galactosidase [Nocardioides sp. Root1257]KRC45688.1 beta-galactosidase [Nocardioides sp. Root224]